MAAYGNGTAAPRNRVGGGGWGVWAWVIGILIVAFAIWAIWAFAWKQSAGPQVGATIESVTDNPQASLGRTVTVSGELYDVIGPRSFTIGGDGLVGGDELLVFVPPTSKVDLREIGIPAEPGTGMGGSGDAEDAVLRVTGPVQMLYIADFEREYGPDFDAALFADWEGRPVVVATAVERLPQAE